MIMANRLDALLLRIDKPNWCSSWTKQHSPVRIR